MRPMLGKVSGSLSDISCLAVRQMTERAPDVTHQPRVILRGRAHQQGVNPVTAFRNPASAPAIVGAIASTDAVHNVKIQRLFTGEGINAIRQKRTQFRRKLWAVLRQAAGRTKQLGSHLNHPRSTISAMALSISCLAAGSKPSLPWWHRIPEEARAVQRGRWETLANNGSPR